MHKVEKMELPSKELINAVMDFMPDAIDVGVDGKSIDLYMLTQEDGSVSGGGNINIYELMHMMKEWVRRDQYILTLCYHLDTVAAYLDKDGGGRYCSPSMSIYTEFEAVTKACEWILINEG